MVLILKGIIDLKQMAKEWGLYYKIAKIKVLHMLEMDIQLIYTCSNALNGLFYESSRELFIAIVRLLFHVVILYFIR